MPKSKQAWCWNSSRSVKNRASRSSHCAPSRKNDRRSFEHPHENPQLRQRARENRVADDTDDRHRVPVARLLYHDVQDRFASKQKVRVFNQVVKKAFINNPRFPKFEQELIKELLPDTKAWGVDPEAAIEDVNVMYDTLVQLMKIKERVAGRPNVTLNRKAELSDQMNSIQEVLHLIEGVGEAGEEEAKPLPKGIPEGSVNVGTTKDGEEAWRTPDGELRVPTSSGAGSKKK